MVYRETASAVARTLAFAALLALIYANPYTDNDLWGHVRFGSDSLERGLTRSATYTYAAATVPWVNHEHLSEMFLAETIRSTGQFGPLLAKSLLGILLSSIVLIHGRLSNASRIATVVTLLVIAMNLRPHWVLRPHVFSFVLLSIELLVLDWAFSAATHKDYPPDGRRWSRDLLALLLLPPIFGLWANLHGGFVMGLAILLIFLCCHFIGEVYAQTSIFNARIWYLLLIASLSSAATLLTPYGIQLHGWLYRALSMPRPEIVEWQPVAWLDADSANLLLLLAACLVTLACSRHPINKTHVVVSSAVLIVALLHRRHVAFLYIVVAHWLPVHLSSAFVGVALPSGRLWRQTPARTIICSLVTVLAVAYPLWSSLSGMRVSKAAYPVAAVAFLNKHGLADGRMVVAFDWAQFIIYAFGARHADDPGVQVGFDGRFRTCYAQATIDMHFDFELGPGSHRYRESKSFGPADASRALNSGDPNLVLISRNQRHAVAIMESQRRDWVLLYQDAIAQLWGRARLYDDSTVCSFLPPEKREVSETPQLGHVLWPAVTRP